MISFIGYINNAMIKFQIYFTSHMHIAGQMMDMIPERFYVLIQEHGPYKHTNALFVYLRIHFFKY
jgi:hypothetical protein